MEAAIRACALTKRFGSRSAPEDVTFDVSVGEVFGFLGPNGAGKTTSVRVLSTLARPPQALRRSPGSRCRRKPGPSSGAGSRS